MDGSKKKRLLVQNTCGCFYVEGPSTRVKSILFLKELTRWLCYGMFGKAGLNLDRSTTLLRSLALF